MSYLREQESVANVNEAQINSDEKLVLAQLIVSAAPQFYALLPCSEQKMLTLVAEQIGEPGTELQNTYILRYGGRVSSILSAVGDNQIATARLSSSMNFIRKLGRSERACFLSTLKRFSKELEPIDEPGIYISRLATVSTSNTAGAGARLLKWFLLLSGPGLYTCHVHKDNTIAMWLNQKVGFKLISELNTGAFNYRALVLEQ
jgi:hypothetical protein